MTYRTPQDELLGCLSLLEEEKVERIYVIDNSPTDEIRSLVQEFRTVEYIHRPDNPGYGAAHNVAIRDVLSRGVEYHLVLNSDITFERGTLAAIIEMMDRRPETGLLQPRIRYPDGRASVAPLESLYADRPSRERGAEYSLPSGQFHVFPCCSPAEDRTVRRTFFHVPGRY